MPPVLRTLEQIALNGNHLEIAYLVIPGKNDDPVAFGDIVQWIRERLGQQVSLHINRYFPCHRMNLPPTSRETLEALADVARAILPHVYLGNI